MHSGRSVKPLHLLLCSFPQATSPWHSRENAGPRLHSQMLDAHRNLFSLTKLSADELSVNESDTDGVSFTENKHELQNWKRKNDTIRGWESWNKVSTHVHKVGKREREDQK